MRRVSIKILLIRICLPFLLIRTTVDKSGNAFRDKIEITFRHIQSPSNNFLGRNCSVINWNPKELKAYQNNN